MSKLCMLVIIVVMAVMTSCTAIPPEAVQLSTSVGQMISKAKVAHINMVDQHFDQLALSVDKFAMSEYKQAFLDNIRRLMKQKDPNFTDLTPNQYDAAMTRIMNARQGWLQAVWTNKKLVLKSLEDYYALIEKANVEVTNILRSAAGIDSSKNRLVTDFTSQFGEQARDLENKLLGSNSNIQNVLNDALKKVLGD